MCCFKTIINFGFIKLLSVVLTNICGKSIDMQLDPKALKFENNIANISEKIGPQSL